ncbi:hypothetical protein Btru_032154 [Bulinus truncatus]|nr:hypothetical protein Btru_032154 [Bulinus truncatus]
MASLSRFFGDEVVELFKNAKFLSEEESKNDPDDEPFRSKYKAREIYKDISNKIKDKLNDILSERSVDFNSLLTLSICLEQIIGLNYMDTEEFAEGEDFLMSCLKRIQEYGLKDAVSLHINILNYLGILWSERRNLEKALEFLTQAEILYANYKRDIGDAPLAFTEFLDEYEGDDNEKARQRSENYTEARHCLASGSLIFESSKKSPDQLAEQELELQSQREADIERCWIKYGLGLLEASRDKMLGELETVDDNASGPSDNKANEANHNADKNVENSDVSNALTESCSDKVFQEFQLELTAYEENVTDKFVRTFDEARKIFLFIVDKVKNAQKFYSLESHASDAVQIIQDHSRAYKLLAFFELDMNRQCRMHKRRIDILSDLLKELNPRHYLLVCRQLMYELAETFSEMVDLKVTLIEMERTRATPYSTSKINKLIQQSIDKYEAYINSLKAEKTELPTEFPEGDVRPALVAFFCMGRLYSKFLESEMPERIAKLSKSLECYKFVINYCEVYTSAKELIPNELSLCKEMVSILPLKMARLTEQL